MDVSKDEDDNLVYTYKIKPGICNIEGAIEILKTMEYPSEILENIQKYDTPVENEAEKKE
jgi:DNA mismatch repair ATPase MutS